MDLEALHYEEADEKTRLYNPIVMLGETRLLL